MRLSRRGLLRFDLFGFATLVMVSLSRFPFRQQVLDLAFVARETFGLTRRFRNMCSFANLAGHSAFA